MIQLLVLFKSNLVKSIKLVSYLQKYRTDTSCVLELPSKIKKHCKIPLNITHNSSEKKKESKEVREKNEKIHFT